MYGVVGVLGFILVGVVTTWLILRRRAAVSKREFELPQTKRVTTEKMTGDVRPGAALTSASALRRRHAIISYVGRNGSGKTLSMILDTLPDLAAGKKVLSTVPLFAPEPAETEAEADEVWAELGLDARSRGQETLLPHPLWEPLQEWRQFMDFTDGVVLLDEITGVADARDTQGLPVQVRNKLQQLRKADIIVRWTTPNYTNADKRLRDVTQGVVYCKGFFSKWEAGDAWGRKRLIFAKLYKADEFDDFEQARLRSIENRRPKVYGRELRRVVGRHMKKATGVYSSFAPALSLGFASEAGMCMACGGRRSLPRCSCPKDTETHEHPTGETGPEEGRARGASANPPDRPRPDDRAEPGGSRTLVRATGETMSKKADTKELTGHEDTDRMPGDVTMTL